MTASSCAHGRAAPQLNDGTVARQFDPYTGKTAVAIEYLLETVPPPTIDRDADETSAKFALAFVRDPSAGDVVVLRARHECWYNLKGKRIECLPAGCPMRPQPVEVYGRLDGSPAQMPRFECKGWGRAAVEYSATFSRQAMQTIASGSEFWMRLPTGEIRLSTTQISNLRSFLAELDRTPVRAGPESIDLRR